MFMGVRKVLPCANLVDVPVELAPMALVGKVRSEQGTLPLIVLPLPNLDKDWLMWPSMCGFHIRT